MSHTVVVRLTPLPRDGRLRGVAEDVPSGEEHRFTTADELLIVLHRIMGVALTPDHEVSRGDTP